jgi:hypothetical protein
MNDNILSVFMLSFIYPTIVLSMFMLPFIDPAIVLSMFMLSHKHGQYNSRINE